MNNRLGIAAAVVVGLCPLYSAAAAADRVCQPTEAVASVAQNERDAITASSTATEAPLKLMMAINSKATKPGPIKDQISIADQHAFNEARAELIKIKMFRSAMSRDTRNMRLIDQLAEFDEIVDMDNFDISNIKDTDPRAFYFTLIAALREVQPTPKETTLPEYKGVCTMEAALSLTEHFNMQQMASHPTDKAMLNLILDTQRLEQLLAIMQKAKELDLRDAANIRLDAKDDPQLDESFTKWLATQPTSSQKIGNVILRYIDTAWPSKSNYEMNREAAQTDQIKAEYPK